jgi:hypothetical protein
LRDKVVQKAIADVLAPRLERLYRPNLYSYRKGRFFGNRAAARKVKAMLKANPTGLHVFKTDIPSYTDQIDQKRMFSKFSTLLADEPEILQLIEVFIRQRCLKNGAVFTPEAGIPTGSPLTPVCANLYLAELDELMFREGFCYFRYGDDILVLDPDRKRIDRAKELIAEIVRKNGLTLSPSKTHDFAPGEAFDYLGYRFSSEGIAVGAKTLRKYRRWLVAQLPRHRYLRSPNRTESDRRALLRRILWDLNREMNEGFRKIPWLRSFPLVEDEKNLKAVDRFLKDRIRLCILRRVSVRNRRLIPESWFREYGYRSLAGAYYRIRHHRPLGPYQSWRRHLSVPQEEDAPKDAGNRIARAWRRIKFRLEFFRRALNAGTAGDRSANAGAGSREFPGPPSSRF